MSTTIFVKNSSTVPALESMPTKSKAGVKFWSWGSNNMLPTALALMSRRSATHRRIINDKADYISGKGFSYDMENDALSYMVECANGEKETLRSVVSKLAFDKALFGNAFVEVVTNQDHSFLSLYHQDASKCRLDVDGAHVLMHHDWPNFRSIEALSLPLYPAFEQSEDGTMRSMIHYKDYEPMFEHYGVPPYIAGMNVSTIAYKTDKWNISRLDNSFQMSGVMVLDAHADDQAQAEQFVDTAQKKFAGKPGQVLFMVKDAEGNDNSKFIPISSDNDGDWSELHTQATSDIVIAHSWFRSLSGLEYTGGFNSERILHEYEIALNTVILSEQEELMDPIKEVIANVLGADSSSLVIVNRPPATSKPLYMKVWEARKSEGLDYDPQDPSQDIFLAQLT